MDLFKRKGFVFLNFRHEIILKISSINRAENSTQEYMSFLDHILKF